MRNMQGQKFISRVNFEATKHHRQLIRQQIKPELFQQLEVSHNPATNYLNACKGVFKDELEKTMEQHLQKKMKNQYEHLDDKAAYSMNPMTQSRLQEHHMANSSMNNQNSRQPFNHQPMNRLQMNHLYENNRNQYQKPANSPINCSKFRDYNEERTNKFESHIKNTFDGGQQFFKVHDAYQEKKVKETQNYADFLRKQVEQKKYSKLSQRQKQNMQHMAYKQMQSYQAQLDKQKYMRQYENKSYQKMDKMHEVEQQRLRKQRRSQQFQYNSIALHNPITNPIEYHIDNPYILKKIQDRSGL